jgi:hypothetical protein
MCQENSMIDCCLRSYQFCNIQVLISVQTFLYLYCFKMVVLKFNTSDGIPLQFDIAVIDDGDVLPDKADLDRKNLEYRSLQKISKHLFIKVNQRGGMLYQLIKDVLVTFNSGLSGQVNDENKRSRPPSSASASASASPESKIQRSQSTRDVSKSQ